MKCCESQTTSTVPSPHRDAGERDAAESARTVAAQFEGLLWQRAFAPLAKAIGFYGDAVVAATAQHLARNAGGPGSALERALEAVMHEDVRNGGAR